MGLFSWIAGIFEPAVKLVDDLHTSDEEKMQLRNKLAEIQEKANAKLIELEKAKVEALSKVQVAESNSKYAITATWRPITSMLLVALIIAGSFGWVALGKEIYDLAEIMLGGYAIGRSAEKVAHVAKLGK